MMPETCRERAWRRLAVSGGARGAALGLSFTVAEVVAGYCVGERFPWLWWAFLAAYYVPAFALLGALLGLMGRGVVALFHAAFFAYVYIVAVQEALPGMEPSASGRLAALAVAAGAMLASIRALERLRPGPDSAGPFGVVLLLPFAVTLGARVASLALAGRGWAIAMGGVVGLPLILVVGVAWLAARTSRRHSFVALAGLCVAVGSWGLWRSSDRSSYSRSQPQPAPAPAAHGRPNIVLVVLDTVRAQSLSCYGHRHPTTPWIDRFASKAVRYARCTTPAPWSLPAHASLFTGLFPSRHGAHALTLVEFSPDRDAQPLADRFDTLAEILAGAGYATAGFAANPLLGAPYNLSQGFNRFETRASERHLAFDSGPLLFRVRRRAPYALLVHPIAEAFPGPYPTGAAVTAWAERWLNDERPRDRPYFLFLNYMDAHTPYAPRRRTAELSPGWPENPRLPPNDLSPSAVRAILTGEREIQPHEARHLEALYDGALAWLDEQVGHLLEFLEGQQDASNTWIIVTADHGEALGEHHLIGHSSSLYEEIVHVPLVVRYPRALPEQVGRVDERPVQLVDILPTILASLLLPPRSGLDGVPFAAGRTRMLGEAFACQSPHAPDLFRREIHSITAGGFKYIATSNAPEQLFDLEADPHETRSLVTALPGRASELRGQLESWTRELASAVPDRPSAPLDPQQRERLRALGYVP